MATRPVQARQADQRAESGRVARSLTRWEATVECAFERRSIWIGVVAVLAILQSWLIVSHRPWLDEWQALQIALQSPDLTALFENLRYEGHPPLWYLLLRFAAVAVPAGWVLAAVQLPIAAALQAIILFRAPFTRLQRLFLATSFFVLFDYGVLSRSLGMGVLLLTVAVAFRRHRASWIAIALLPMADFLFGILSVACVVLQARERRLWRPGVALWIALGALAAFAVRPAADVVPAFHPEGVVHGLGSYIDRLSVLLVPLHMAGSALRWNEPLPIVIAPIAGALFLIFGDRQLRHRPLDRALFIGFALVTASFSIFVYPLAIRHLSLLAWLLVLLKWRGLEEGAALDAPFRLWLFVISLCGLGIAAMSLAKPFDTADQAAAYIERHGLTRAHWISFPDSRAQGVSAMTGTEFDRLERDCRQSFVRWNVRPAIRKPADLEKALRHVTARYGRTYLLSDLPLETMDPALLKPLAHFPPGYDGQDFYLFAVGPDRPETDRLAPPCAPQRLPLKIGGYR